MLYHTGESTLIDTIAPGLTRSDGRRLDDAGVRELAGLLGRQVTEGPVEKVAVVFFDQAEANGMLDTCKRYGVECRALVDGEEKVLHPGQRVAIGDGAPKGPLLPLLREESWPHLPSTANRRLLTHPNGPHVTFGWDMGTSVARMSPADQGDRPLADVEREALENLARQKYELTKIPPNSVMLSSEYGAEMILLPKVMREVQAMIGAPLIAVGVPKEGGFIAGDASTAIEGVLLWTRKIFDEAKGRRISPLPFLVQDGAIVGFASAQFSTDPPPAAGQGKPWWKFW